MATKAITSLTATMTAKTQQSQLTHGTTDHKCLKYICKLNQEQKLPKLINVFKKYILPGGIQ